MKNLKTYGFIDRSGNPGTFCSPYGLNQPFTQAPKISIPKNSIHTITETETDFQVLGDQKPNRIA